MTPSRILLPSTGPDDWRRFLADPDRHWAKGYSARTLAHAWEAAGCWPPEIGAILDAAFGNTDLLLAIPERKTPLPGGRRESQSDVFALGRHAAGLVAVTVEGKVDEPFGPTLGEWLRDASPGKLERLAFLRKLLGIADCPPDLPYQLLHRTGAALVEAARFHAADAAMLVHSFSPGRRWFDAWSGFVSLMGGIPGAGGPIAVAVPGGRRLVLGWACGPERLRAM